MCLQLERSSSSVRTKPNTTWNMVKEKLDTYFIYIDCAWNLQNLIQFLMCIHDVTYLHKWEIDKTTWMHNMEKGDYLNLPMRPSFLKANSELVILHSSFQFETPN